MSSHHLEFFPKGLPYDFGSKFWTSSKCAYSQIGQRNIVRWCFRVKSKSFIFDLKFLPKELVYDFVWKFQISSKFVYSQLGPRNHVCWCFGVKLNWSWRHMKMSNLISRHLEFFPEGLAYDLGSKFQISWNFVYGQMWPENDVCWCFRVKSKLFWQKKRRYQMWAATILNFFQRGYPMILGQNFERLQSVHIVKLDKEILFVDVLEWNQSHSSSIVNFFQKSQNFKCLQSVHIVKLNKEILFVDVLEWNQSHSDKLWIKFEQPPSWIFS